jgi:hypothetical protein
MAKNSKKKSFKSKDTKDTNLNDYYTLGDLSRMRELNYMTTPQMLETLKQNNIVPLVLKPPFDQQLIFKKSEIDLFLDEKLN